MKKRLFAAMLSIALILALLVVFVHRPAAPEKETYFQELFIGGMMRNNNITVDTVGSDEIGCSYVKISGLADKDVEQYINDRIYSVYRQMYDMTYIPPYRGMAARQREYDFSAVRKYIYAVEGCNCNNLLSVYMEVGYYSGSDHVFSYTVPLNFDLTDGHELELSELFDSRTDYLNEINGQVYEEIESGAYDPNYSEYNYDSALVLTAPFKGISPDQKFFVSAYGQLELFFDYDTPEFATSFYSQSVYLDRVKGICPAAGSDEMVFEDGWVSYTLLPRFDDYLTSDSDDDYYDISDEPDVPYDYWQVNFNSDMPEEVIDFARDLVKNEDNGLLDHRAMLEQARGFAQSDGLDWYMEGWRHADVSAVSSYYTVRLTDHVNQSARVYNEETGYYDYPGIGTNRCRYYCFREISPQPVTILKPMTLEDIFYEEEVDIQDAIRTAIMLQFWEEKNDYLDKTVAEELCDLLLPHLDSAGIYPEQLSLAYDGYGEDEICEAAAELLDEKGITYSINAYYPYDYALLLQNAPYKYFNCERLTIFHNE